LQLVTAAMAFVLLDGSVKSLNACHSRGKL
jgi:hypothetical protein